MLSWNTGIKLSLKGSNWQVLITGKRLHTGLMLSSAEVLQKQSLLSHLAPAFVGAATADGSSLPVFPFASIFYLKTTWGKTITVLEMMLNTYERFGILVLSTYKLGDGNLVFSRTERNGPFSPKKQQKNDTKKSNERSEISIWPSFSFCSNCEAGPQQRILLLILIVYIGFFSFWLCGY